MSIIELTVPSEENVEAAGERKKTKYATIREEGKANGWNVRVWAVEIGCRGFPAASMASFLKDIGIRGSERTKQLKKMGKQQREQVDRSGAGAISRNGVRTVHSEPSSGSCWWRQDGRYYRKPPKPVNPPGR